MRNNTVVKNVWCVALCMAMLAAAAQAQNGARDEGTEAGRGDYAAGQLLERAKDLLLVGETERGVKMVETILQQYPESPIRYKAYLTLGKHFHDTHEYPRAIQYLSNLKEMAARDPEKKLTGESQDLYLEGMYLIGVCHFKSRQYGMAFPVLRKITRDYPNTVWANQAFYYIGMCHFAQSNWSKAINALNFVGTFVDPTSPAVEYIEAGRRFYVKVSDADLPILHRLGRDVAVTVSTSRGDSESVPCIPLSEDEGLFIGSIPTEIGNVTAKDGKLQVIGGDTITAEYIDSNTLEGESNVARDTEVRVVSTASLAFTLGTFDASAPAAFIGQPLFVMLKDADLDVSDKQDAAKVKIISRYPDPDAQAVAEETEGVDVGRLLEAEQKKYIVRDEVTVDLREFNRDATPATSSGAVRSGLFGGNVRVVQHNRDEPVDKTDQMLTCAVGDEVIATYIDELHIGGANPRQAQSRTTVLGELDSHPRATQSVVNDPKIKAQKNLVEGQAYLELGRIFKSMGLTKGAKEKVAQGLDLANSVLRIESPIPDSLKEQAFKLKWELHIVEEDYSAAVNTCRVFSRVFPDSPFVDEALMGIGRIHFENKDYGNAITVFRGVTTLPNSQARAEAQYMIARTTEEMRGAGSEAAIQQYKVCAERYPDSKFAGESLAKLADYYIRTKDYTQADSLLEQVFQDYPDAQFLDRMLLKWVLVSYYTGNYQKAYDKCTRLIFEYPSSSYAETAKKILPKIEAAMKRSSG